MAPLVIPYFLLRRETIHNIIHVHVAVLIVAICFCFLKNYLKKELQLKIRFNKVITITYALKKSINITTRTCFYAFKAGTISLHRIKNLIASKPVVISIHRKFNMTCYLFISLKF